MRRMTIDSSLQMQGVFTRRMERPCVSWVKENARWIYEKEHPDEEHNQVKRGWLMQRWESESLDII